jgi:hypothetical protein
VRRAGLVAVALGVAGWAVTVVVWTASILVKSAYDMPGDEVHLWAQEVREAGILLVALGFVLALPEVLPAAAPSVLLFAALLTADSVLDAADAHGARALFGALVLGAGLVGLAWQAARVLGADRAAASVHSGRRRYAAVSVVAAYCAPALFAQTDALDHGGPVAVGLPVMTAVTVAALAVVAMLSALGARREPVRTPAAIALVAAPALVLGAIGALTGNGSPLVQYAVVLGPPFVVYSAAVMRWRGIRPVRGALRWTALGIGALVLGVPVAYLALAPGILFGSALIRAAGYAFPVDGLPYLPGVLVFALGLAMILPGRLVGRVPAIREEGDVLSVPSHSPDQSPPFRI